MRHGLSVREHCASPPSCGVVTAETVCDIVYVVVMDIVLWNRTNEAIRAFPHSWKTGLQGVICFCLT